MPAREIMMAREEADVYFPPILNGIDYLVSVIAHLRCENNDPSPRDLKYAVLHLRAASEVLLKARLQKEHWSLTVRDASKTNRIKHQEGDFESPNSAETIRRLVEVLGISITDADRRALLNLAKTRNALQHWGLTESAPALEARAVAVLDFLIRFLDNHLLKELDEAERAAIGDDLYEIRLGLSAINAYVESRLERLRGELSGESDHTVTCPECMYTTVVLNGVQSECHFCPRFWEPEELAQEYVSQILNHFADTPKEPLIECPECEIKTLVLGVLIGTGDVVNICFNCAKSFTSLKS
jgi:hypothetical protein